MQAQYVSILSVSQIKTDISNFFKKKSSYSTNLMKF
jgi:hypothetical protein